MEEAGAVFLGEGGGAAGHDAVVAELGANLPRGQGVADGLLGEDATFRSEDVGAFLEASRGKGDVGRDHNVVLVDVIDDPVVGRVKVVAHEDQFDPVGLGNGHRRVGHERHAQGVALGHAVDLVLHGAAIGIDEDFGQVGTSFC